MWEQWGQYSVLPHLPYSKAGLITSATSRSLALLEGRWVTQSAWLIPTDLQAVVSEQTHHYIFRKYVIDANHLSILLKIIIRHVCITIYMYTR